MGIKGLILLATVDPDMGAVMGMVLRQLELPYALAAAHTGKQTLRYFPKDGESRAGSSPEILLLDLRIRKPLAFDVLRCLRNRPATRHLPIVVLAGSVFDQNLTRAYQEGANTFLVKAYGYAAILEQVREIAQQWLTRRAPIPNGRLSKRPRKLLSLPWAGDSGPDYWDSAAAA